MIVENNMLKKNENYMNHHKVKYCSVKEHKCLEKNDYLLKKLNQKLQDQAMMKKRRKKRLQSECSFPLLELNDEAEPIVTISNTDEWIIVPDQKIDGLLLSYYRDFRSWLLSWLRN